MGATTFELSYRGMSAKQVYTNAVSDARSEYGNDAYNGTITTTSGYKDVTNRFKRSGKSLADFVNDMIENECQKWGEAYIICTKQPKGKKRNRVEVINKPQKGTRKWITKYRAYTISGGDLFTGEKQTEIIKRAKKYAADCQVHVFVEIFKELKNGNTQVAHISPKLNTEEQGKYYLFGWAAE